MKSYKLRQDAPEAESFRVTSFEELYELMSNLHDCWFDLDESGLDCPASVWTGFFLRPLWQSLDARRSQRKWILSRFLTVEDVEVPAAKGVIQVGGVKEARILSDQGIGRYMFNELKSIEGGIRLDFCEALRIELNLVTDIEVTYDEAFFPEVRLTYSNFPFGAQTGPGMVKA